MPIPAPLLSRVAAFLFAAAFATLAAAQAPQPPEVAAKSYLVLDLTTDQTLAERNADASIDPASLTKLMTAYIVFQALREKKLTLEQELPVSMRAWAERKGGGSLMFIDTTMHPKVDELLRGLIVQSGNDAAVALAEHFGPRVALNGDAAGDPVRQFVVEMTRRARGLGLKVTSFADPNGLSQQNQSTAAELATLTWHAMQNTQFRQYVQTRRHECEVTGADGEKRSVTWTNIQRLLDIEGYDGVKTGTTTPAGSCLVASGHRGDDRLIVVVLGSTSTDGRYADARNLFRWAWLARGHRPEGPTVGPGGGR